MPEFLDSNYLEGAQSYFLRVALNRAIYQKMQKKSVFGVFNKISISVLNFSTNSAKKPTNYDLVFLTAIYSPKNDNKHPRKMRN